MKQCIFCQEGLDFSYSKAFLGKHWSFPNRVIYHDGFLYAVVGCSPQVCPYILIIPYRHIFSMAEMSENEQNSFLVCLDRLKSSNLFGSSLCFFEHGGTSEAGSSSIDHCHIHVISGNTGFFDLDCFNHFQKIKHFHDLKTYDSAYFLLGTLKDGSLTLKATSDTLHEHQYFRKVLAQKLGEETWDWRKDMRIETMREIMTLFSN